ncbi:transposase family protein, partial [Streptomyces sp. NPDC048650]|uniref:transposase family protein n=1 Tax=Streptomyces sp. NPDC048650 TaxID=3365583 RepID=UPI003715E54B
MEETVLRLDELLSPSVADVTVLSVDVNDETVRIEACSAAAGAACPGCGSGSSRIHSSYLRSPVDVPSAGRRVVLCLRVRRCFCRDASCRRRTFVEQMPGRPGDTAGGQSGCTRRWPRLVSRSPGRRPDGKHLRGVRQPQHGLTTARCVARAGGTGPRVVGVDECATRKGHIYGTVLVDVETRRPMDLLPDRETSSLAKWLAKQPGIAVVCRDRAPFFAEGTTARAPRRLRLPTEGTCGTTSSRLPSGPSPVTASACASWSPNRPVTVKNTTSPHRPKSPDVALEERPVRQPHPSQALHRPRDAGCRPQPPTHRPPAPRDPPHRQKPRRHRQARRPLPRAMAAPPDL